MNGISRIENAFQNTQAFVGYLTVGDGGVQHTLQAALALIAGGVNMLELGVPFSDPIADGPVIQRAASRALAAETTLQDILWLTKEIRKKSAIPLILFSYLNPLLAALNSSFLQEAASTGIDGILVVDCPIEESDNFHQKCHAHNLAPIYVIAPSTPLARIHTIAQQGSGFLYYACRKGTTGIQSDLPENFMEKMQLIKFISPLPVISGFGIARRDTARKVLQYADGVVVGSLFVNALEEGLHYSALTHLALSINPLAR